ncbi:hypothetical protein N9A28_02555 [Sulfurimonas sp.]|nr:hypothetical protein [Sulfurimonas sp.]
MTKIKDFKIFKPNEIIETFLADTQANSVKLIDRFWHEMEVEVHKRGKLGLEERFNTKYSLQDLKSFLNLPDSVKSYHSIIEEALDGLCVSIKIKNYTDRDGKVVKTANQNILSYKEYDNSIENAKEKIYEISLSSELFNLITQKKKKNFTNLYSRHQEKLRTGVHIVLYQRLKSLQFLKYKKHEIDLETFKGFLPITRTKIIDDKASSKKIKNTINKKPLKYISEAEKIVKRALEPINKYTDILVSYKVDKKYKLISFKIEINRDNMTDEEIAQAVKNQNNKKQTKEEVIQEEEQKILDNLLNNK